MLSHHDSVNIMQDLREPYDPTGFDSLGLVHCPPLICHKAVSNCTAKINKVGRDD